MTLSTLTTRPSASGICRWPVESENSDRFLCLCKLEYVKPSRSADILRLRLPRSRLRRKLRRISKDIPSGNLFQLLVVQFVFFFVLIHNEYLPRNILLIYVCTIIYEFVGLQPNQIILADFSFFIFIIFCNKRSAILLNGCCWCQILFITAKYSHS